MFLLRSVWNIRPQEQLIGMHGWSITRRLASGTIYKLNVVMCLCSVRLRLLHFRTQFFPRPGFELSEAICNS